MVWIFWILKIILKSPLICIFWNLVVLKGLSEKYWELCQAFKMERIAKIVNDLRFWIRLCYGMYLFQILQAPVKHKLYLGISLWKFRQIPRIRLWWGTCMGYKIEYTYDSLCKKELPTEIHSFTITINVLSF